MHQFNNVECLVYAMYYVDLTISKRDKQDLEVQIYLVGGDGDRSYIYTTIPLFYDR